LRLRGTLLLFPSRFPILLALTVMHRDDAAMEPTLFVV
jgi:hypothetical protein